ncbi:hypothetical protein FGADI_12809 [Fusarium gaditjirri]|uniref:Uncharacterized protein n=1 Tax=Fusarium gaditjirri TaxID=282569 RepID=A0A8H4WNJ9_9HYPO|nr:hypothetical protein FGADI_12809 [Fusarium gaditjirri]
MSGPGSQDPNSESSDDFFPSDDSDNTTLNVSIDEIVNSFLLYPQEPFINPPTFSPEETERCLQRAIDQFWADDQANGAIKPESPVTEAPTPTNVAPTTPTAASTSDSKSSPAPSATPDAKPIPQARARGIKRAREPKPSPSPRVAKQPASRNGQLAAKKTKTGRSNEVGPRLYRPIAPKRAEHYQQQALHANMPSRACFPCLNGPAWVAANDEATRYLGQQYNRPRQLAQMGMLPQRPPQMVPQQTQMGIIPRGIPPYNGNIPFSSPMPHQQQAQMGINPPVIPSPHIGNIARSSHMVPHQRANEMAMGSMGSMGHHQLRGNGIPVVNQPSMGNLRANGNAMMDQNNGPVVNAPGSSMWYL